MNRSEKIRLKKEAQLRDFIAKNYNEFSIESPYQKSSKKIKIKHLICDYIFERKPDYIYQNGLTCPRCYKEKPSHKRKSPEQYRRQFYEVYGDSLILKSDYIDGETKVIVECLKGHSWESNPFYLLKGKGCPQCNKEKFISPLRKSHEQFVQEMREKFGDEYTILGKYELYNKPILVRHNECGHEWSPIASNLYANGSCPKCRQSKGEKAIREYLSQNGYDFKEQFMFNDCRGTRYSLRFDFCVFKDKKIWFLIEYDGEFHFKENKIYKDEFTRKQKFKELQQRDRTKTEYCKLNGYPLLRIPYWEKENIPEIISNFISTLNNERSWLDAYSNR